MTDRLLQSVRMGARSFTAAPGFTAVVVVTLALGIGANTAIFSLLDQLLLRSLPINRPEQLFTLQTGDYSYPAYQAFRRGNESFDDLFASAPIERVNVDLGSGTPEPARVSLVSGPYFPVLGVSAVAGRVFTAADEDGPRAEPVAVASFGFWQRRLGGEPSAVGRALRVGNSVVTLVGIAPPSFFGERIGDAPDLWVPLTHRPKVISGRDLLASQTASWLVITGRLKEGASRVQAEAALTAQYRDALRAAFASEMSDDRADDIAREIVTLRSARTGVPTDLRSTFAQPLLLLMAGVGLLLALACANVATLLLARAVARRREVGVRVALGGSRQRLFQELLVEHALLAGAGTTIGLPLAWLIRGVILTLIGTDAPVVLTGGIDGRVLLFATGVMVTTTLLCGLLPALQALSVSPLNAFAAARTESGSAARLRSGRVLVITQVALSLMLMSTAGLFVRTMLNARELPLGFTRDRLVLVEVNPRAAGYENDRYTSVVGALRDRLGALPGVSTVGSSENGILRRWDSSTDQLRRRGDPQSVDGVRLRFDLVGGRYFETLGIPVLAGRTFNISDRDPGPYTVVINAAMAETLYPGVNPVGEHVSWGPFGAAPLDFEIIGVVGNVRPSGPREPVRPRFYLASAQLPDHDLYNTVLSLRVSGDLGTTDALIRAAVRAEDPALPVERLTNGDVLMDSVLVQERLLSGVATAFGLLALTFAALGLYSLLAFTVRRRAAEVGVRIAVGATPVDIVRLVVGGGMALVGAGLVIGAVGAVAASRAIAGLLFEVTPTDPATFAVTAALVSAVGLAACALPALRAARLDPVRALRTE